MITGLFYIMPITLLVIGIIQTIYPEKACMFSRKHMCIQESTVTNKSKVLIRIAGIMTIFLGVMIFVITTIVILKNV